MIRSQNNVKIQASHQLFKDLDRAVQWIKTNWVFQWLVIYSLDGVCYTPLELNKSFAMF